VSPWEWSFPFPYWLQRAHSELRRGPTDLPGPETLCIAHALHQLCAGFLGGHTGSHAWACHVLGDKTGDGKNCVRAFFGRFEFQDKGPAQEHGKGRGTPHVHCLYWLQHVPDVLLHRSLCATMPAADAEVAAVARRVLRSNTGPSRAPPYDGPGGTSWNAAEQRWEVRVPHHGPWLEANLRPCVLPLLRLLRCSQDVQWWHGRGALLRYVSGYAAKYGESLTHTSLEVHTTPLATALHISRTWCAAAPEQMMALAREAMSFSSVASKAYRPPTFDHHAADETLYKYRRRAAEEEAASLLQWLRRTTVSGSLADGTMRATPSRQQRGGGVAAVAVAYNKFPRDLFFWQWLLMTVPHRMTHELLPAATWRVSKDLRFFTAAVLGPGREQWGNDTWVKNYLERQGHRSDYVATQVDLVRARRWQVHLQVSGVRPPRPGAVDTRADLAPFSREQEGVLANIVVRLDEYLNAPYVADDDDAIPVGNIQTALKITGGPGSGKTHVIRHAVAAAQARDIPVLVTSPTGRLAANLGGSMPGVVSTTIHRAFLRNNTVDVVTRDLQEYGLWIVGEMGMVPKNTWERISYLWNACGRWPVLCCEGDFAQMAPPIANFREQDARLSRSLRWHLAMELRGQHRCTDADLMAFQLGVRDRQPSVLETQRFFEPLLVSRWLTQESLHAAWRAVPGAPVICATRATAEQINLEALSLEPGESLGDIPVWCDDHRVGLLPMRRGCRIMITRNIDVSHVVNGDVGILVDTCMYGVMVDLNGREDRRKNANRRMYNEVGYIHLSLRRITLKRLPGSGSSPQRVGRE